MENQEKDEEQMRKDIHDVRTALSVIKTSSEVALLDDTLSASGQEIMRNNIQEVDRASKILSTLLPN